MPVMRSWYCLATRRLMMPRTAATSETDVVETSAEVSRCSREKGWSRFFSWPNHIVNSASEFKIIHVVSRLLIKELFSTLCMRAGFASFWAGEEELNTVDRGDSG